MLSNKIKTHINKLHQKKYRYQFGEFLIEGVKGVEEAIDAGAAVLTVVVEGKRRDERKMQALIEKAEAKSILVEYCGRKDIGDLKATSTFPGVMAIVAMREVTLDDFDLTQPLVCLDGVRDPGNIGTIIRTADWFGFHQLLLSKDCVDPYNEKVVRSTMGSMFRMKMYQSDVLVEDLAWLQETHDYAVAGLMLDGEKLKSASLSQDTVAFVFGSESHGIRPEVEKLLNLRYTIAGHGDAESLNVAMSVGITLFQFGK